MKKVLLGILGVVCAFAAAHAEEQVPLNFKVISVEDQWYGDKGVKVDVKDVKKGVFIMAAGSFKTVYPKTADMLKDIFKSRGIHVVDKIEDADLGLLFAGGNKFGTLEGVENDLGAMPPGESTAIALATGMLYSKMTHGGILPIAGNEFSAKKNGVGDVMVTFAKNPKLNWRGVVTGDDTKTVASLITYHMDRLPEKGEHFSATLLAADMAQFIDQHFAGLPAQEGVAQSSGATPALGVAASAPITTK